MSCVSTQQPLRAVTEYFGERLGRRESVSGWVLGALQADVTGRLRSSQW